MLRLLFSFLLALTLVGCPWPGQAPEGASTVPGDTTLAGTVQWDARLVQATMSEVASASTVSLISTATGETAATTVTDGQGRFRLTFPTTFSPDPAVSYYLEAVKGLGSNQPGRNVARVRTIAKYASGWTTLTNAAAGGGLVLNTTTTSLAIAGALRGVTDFSTYMGVVDPATSAYTQPAGSPVTGTDVSSVKAIVGQALTSDMDPVAGVALSGGNWVRVNSGQALALTQLGPTSGVVGATIQATGSALSQLAENVVGFGGANAAAAASANGTTLSVVVPAGAASGQTTLQVGDLTTLGPLFTVLPSITSRSPSAGVAADAAGRTGSLVTVYGQGFGTSGSITLGGTAMSVASWTNTKVVAALPFGATTGALAVTTGGNTATGPALTVVANAAPNGNFDSLAAGTDPSTACSDGGGSSQVVTASSNARSGGNLLRWSSSVGSHERRFPGLLATKTVIVAGAWVRLNSNVNTWSNGKGVISGRLVVPVDVKVWGTPWLTTMNGSYPWNSVPDSTSMTTYPLAESWQYLQATASAQLGQSYEYGVIVQGGPWTDNGFLWDVDDLVLFQCDP